MGLGRRSFRRSASSSSTLTSLRSRRRRSPTLRVTASTTAPTPRRAQLRDNESTMADDRSYVDANTGQRERLRALVERLSDDELTTPVNKYWTVSGVLGHVAYWDIRVLVL